ncbi:MAG TPA: histidine kinase, partial [Puia sp.]|nr:histidine kinase [Puia sp.]
HDFHRSFICVRVQMNLKQISFVIFGMHFIRFTYKTLLFHLLFWVLYCISNAFLWQTFDKNYNEAPYYGLTRLPLKIASVYINLFLLGQFFFKKKYVTFFTFFLFNLLLAGFVQTYISTSGIFNYQLFTQYSLPICSVVLFSSIFVVIHQFFIQVKESKQLEIDKIKNELNFLKAQFQPHFLFNTLNNIYSLTFNNSQLAGKSILQLSGS